MECIDIQGRLQRQRIVIENLQLGYRALVGVGVRIVLRRVVFQVLPHGTYILLDGRAHLFAHAAVKVIHRVARFAQIMELIDLVRNIGPEHDHTLQQ